MKKSIILLAALSFMVAVPAYSGNDVKPTKNVILMIPDGTSTGLLSASRWYKEYAGTQNATLSLDPYICGLIRSSHVDAPITASAGAATSYLSGILTRQNNIGTFPKNNPNECIVPVDTTRELFPAATVMEAAKIYMDKAIGIVATVEYTHATPAACASHVAHRNSYDVIGPQMAGIVDVLFAGGQKYFSPQCEATLKEREIPYITKLSDFHKLKGTKAWALFAPKATAFEIDREEGKEPSLADMTQKAISMLSQNKKGFFLMVEGSKVDYAAHANDANGAITEFLAFDEAVKVALDFAKKDGNTTVVIVPDHGCAGINVGNSHYSNYCGRDLHSLFGGILNYKATYQTIAKKVTESSPDDVQKIFMDLTGIELSEEQYATLMRLKGVKEYDYMQVANSENLDSYITKIINAPMHIGFVSGNHTGEDVFLAVYNPKDQRPVGWHTNVQLNEYLCQVTGVEGKLDVINNTLFVPHQKALEGVNYEISEGDDGIMEISWFKSKNKFVKVRQGEPWYYVGKKKKDLKLSTVYVKETGTFFLPANITK